MPILSADKKNKKALYPAQKDRDRTNNDRKGETAEITAATRVDSSFFVWKNVFIMNGREWIKKSWNGLLDLVYPPSLYCISCGRIIDDSRIYSLCNECMEAISWAAERTCGKCGRPLSDNDPGSTCFGCSGRERTGRPFYFDKGHVCAGYGAAAQSVIFALKYGGRSDIGDILGEIMYDRMAAEYGRNHLKDLYDFVLPVPVHRDRKERRGYNHADLMAHGLAQRAGIVYEPDALIRIRVTAPMKGLTPARRSANIKGAFEVRKSRSGQFADASVLLADDIFTTGATIDEAAKTLKESGASRVDFISFAAAGDMANG